MVSHLLNIDETLANTVGTGLGLKAMPKPADAAMPTRQDLDPSPKLSIVENGPQRFEGRKLGILVTDGTDAAILKALKAALGKEGATFEIIAPKVGGAKASDGSWIEADQMIDGAPSVLYDAVALLPAAAAMDDLCRNTRRAISWLTPSPIASSSAMSRRRPRCLRRPASPRPISTRASLHWVGRRTPQGFIEELGKLRVWGREPSVKMK